MIYTQKLKKNIHPFFISCEGQTLGFKPDLQLACVSKCVYLSSKNVAQDIELLLSNGITHIVNVTTHIRCLFPEKIVYLSLPVLDAPTENLKCHFEKATDFMRNAIVNAGGKVLVHCHAGISRSTSIVLAYMMRYERRTVENALEYVRTKRPIVQPNGGFMRQLKEYEEELGLGVSNGSN